MAAITPEDEKPKKPRKPRPDPHPHALTYTIDDTGRITGLGRTNIYGLIRDGKLKVSRAAGRTLVIGDSLRALILGTATN